MAKPKYSLTAKHKTNGTFRGVAAVWQNERGLSFTLDRDVESIHYKDGTVLTPASFGKDGVCYGNVYQNDGSAPTPAKRTAASQPSDDTDIPF